MIASGDHPLLVRPVEVEVPGFAILQLLVPMANAWKRRVHNHPTRHPFAVLGSEGIADHIAEVVGHKLDRTIELER